MGTPGQSSSDAGPARPRGGVRDRSYDVLLRCFAGSAEAATATIYARDPSGRVHVAGSWTRDDRQASAAPTAGELVEHAFGQKTTLIRSAASGPEPGHLEVAAVFRSDEQLLGALHATFDPPSARSRDELTWIADSHAHLAGLCMSSAASVADVLGSAPIDELTGCLNHSGTLDVLEVEVERSQRRGHRLSCCKIEIDGLDRIDGANGSAESDRVLVAVGGALRDASRRYDAVGRIAGEEFIVVMPETGGPGRKRAAERFRDTLVSAAAEATSAPIDAYVGVAEWDGESAPRDLVDAADRALRHAHAHSDARVQVESPAGEEADGLSELGHHLAGPLGGDAGRFSPRLRFRGEPRHD